MRQTWLGKKKGRVVALKPIVDREALTVTYQVTEAPNADCARLRPGCGAPRVGRATCRICGATVTADYVKREGQAGRMGVAPLAAVVLLSSGRGREYLPVGTYALPDDQACLERLSELAVDAPEEPLPAALTGGMCTAYGLVRFRDIFTARQLVALCTLAASVRDVFEEMLAEGAEEGRATAVATALAMVIDKVADHCSALCRWIAALSYEGAANTYARQALPMANIQTPVLMMGWWLYEVT